MISLQNNTPKIASTPSAAPMAAKPAAAPAPTDTVQMNSHKSGHIDGKNFSWLDLGKGLIGSVVGGAIEGVGGVAAGLKDFIPVTYAAEKGLWSSKMLGPVLKTTLTLPILAGGIISPAIATIAGAVYGMFEGFVEGSDKNPLAAGAKAIDTCKKMHGDLSKQIISGIQSAAAQTPAKPDDVYEISPTQAVKGLVGSAGSAVIDGVGAAGSTWRHLPSAYTKVSKAIWKSDVALPLKVGGEFLTTAAAIAAVPLAPLAGAVYGLGKGAYNGYKHGVVESAKLAGKDIADYDKSVSKALKEAS